MFSAIQRKEIDKFLSMLYDLAIKEYGIMAELEMVCPFQEVRSDSGTAYPRCNEDESCHTTGKPGRDSK